MALFTGIVGELSSRVGTTLNQPAAPATLAMASSAVALALGTVWTRATSREAQLPAGMQCEQCTTDATALCVLQVWTLRGLAALGLPAASLRVVGLLPMQRMLRVAATGGA